MFGKAFLLFAVLAAFAVQGLNADRTYELNYEDREMHHLKSVISDLLEKVKKLVANLLEFGKTTVVETISVLQNCIETILKAKDDILENGIGAIGDIVGDAKEWIENTTSHALELGFDVSGCVIGRKDQLDSLTEGWVDNLTNGITNITEQALNYVKNDLTDVQGIVKQITGLTGKILKCTLPLPSLKCLTDLVKESEELWEKLPAHIKSIVDGALKLAKSIPETVLLYLNTTMTSVGAQISVIKTDITSCVDAIIDAKSSPRARPIF